MNGIPSTEISALPPRVVRKSYNSSQVDQLQRQKDFSDQYAYNSLQTQGEAVYQSQRGNSHLTSFSNNTETSNDRPPYLPTPPNFKSHEKGYQYTEEDLNKFDSYFQSNDIIGSDEYYRVWAKTLTDLQIFRKQLREFLDYFTENKDDDNEDESDVHRSKDTAQSGDSEQTEKEKIFSEEQRSFLTTCCTGLIIKVHDSYGGTRLDRYLIGQFIQFIDNENVSFKVHNAIEVATIKSISNQSITPDDLKRFLQIGTNFKPYSGMRYFSKLNLKQGLLNIVKIYTDKGNIPEVLTNNDLERTFTGKSGGSTQVDQKSFIHSSMISEASNNFTLAIPPRNSSDLHGQKVNNSKINRTLDGATIPVTLGNISFLRENSFQQSIGNDDNVVATENNNNIISQQQQQLNQHNCINVNKWASPTIRNGNYSEIYSRNSKPATFSVNNKTPKLYNAEYGMIRKSICNKNNNSTDSFGDDVLEDRRIISLKCAISQQRMTMPVKGIECKHATCFDLSYVESSFQDKRNFRCPICKLICPKPAKVDTNLLAILRETKGRPEIEQVIIHSNGTWEELKSNKASDCNESKSKNIVDSSAEQVDMMDDNESPNIDRSHHYISCSGDNSNTNNKINLLLSCRDYNMSPRSLNQQLYISAKNNLNGTLINFDKDNNDQGDDIRDLDVIVIDD